MKLGMDDTPQAEKTIEIEAVSPAQKFRSLADSIGARNLIIAIVTMPLVFVIVVVGIVGLLGEPDGAREGAAVAGEEEVIALLQEPALSEPLGDAVVSPLPVSVDAPAGLALAPGDQIGAMSLDGDRLALRIENANAVRIVIYDIAADRVLKEIPIAGE